MANRRFIDFPIAASVGNNDIVLIWQDGLNKQTTKATLLQGSPSSLAGLTDVDISALNNGQILQYNSTTSKWENVDRTDINLSELGDVTIVAPSNGQVLVYNSSTGKWENSSGGYVPYTGAVTTVNLGAQTIQAGSFVKAGGTSSQFLKANGSVDSTAYGTGTVTSVGLTMPSAFSVANTPITTAGTLAVTGAGTVGQYIRGDGSLADFPATTGGGSSVSYYLNGSISQGTIGGVAYKELNKVPILGAGTDFTINADGYIASFITDSGDPNLLEIPGGNWNFETYFSASSGGGSPSFYVELYKVNSGGTATLIASNSGFPELIAFGTNIISYFSTLAVPTTTLALTDRLAVRYYVTHSGRTITLHTEDNHLCQIITTFTTGITALNGLTAQVQNFAVGTSGTDFNIASATATHTFNLPTASATNRGALSSADWTTFNNKTSNLGTVTSVGLSSATSGVTIGSTPITTSGTITLAIATASGSQNGLLSSTDWSTFNGKQNALTNPVTGTGTTNYLPKFTGSTTIGNSLVFDNGTSVGINNASPSASNKLEVLGTAASPTLVGTNSYARFFQSGGYANVTIGALASGSFAGWIQSSDGVGTSLPLAIQPSGGNVLVGTTTDQGQRLLVQGTGGTTGFTRFTDGVTAAMFIGVNSGTPFIHSNNSVLSFGASGANTFSATMTLSSGNVGIGTTGGINVVSGWTNFVVNGSSTGLVGIKANEVNFGAMYASSANNAFVIQAYGSSNNGIMAFLTASTERMRITSGGNVLIGTTTDNGARLQVSGAADISGHLIVRGTLPVDQTDAAVIDHFSNTMRIFSYGAAGVTGDFQFRTAAGGAGSNLVSTINGTTGAYTAVSDVNKKKDFEESTIGLDAILGLKPTLYRMKSETNTKKHLGFIAQEVRQYIPNAYVENGEFIGLNEMPIIAALTKAIQELKKEIDTLKN